MEANRGLPLSDVSFEQTVETANLTSLKLLQVLELESSNVKALYRRAQAYIQLADLDLAEFDIKKALDIDPNNRHAPFLLFFHAQY